MFSIERAAAYAARYGIPRKSLEAALRAGELPSSGTLPGGGWVIDPGELEEWCSAQ
ncbi:hypothetical protein ACT3TB_16425 [Micrococcaceae sp. AOP34-BR2-30]